MSLTRTLFFSTLFFFFAIPASADVVRSITFPVSGTSTYRDDFHEARDAGARYHLGHDIIAATMTPLVAVVDGYVSYIASPQASWGYEIDLLDSDGYSYLYLHVNNDTPGTDDGRGGEVYAYAPGIARGVRVTAGQLIGWVGDSGNAEETVPHLHFETHDPSHAPIDPFQSLVHAKGAYNTPSFVPGAPIDQPIVLGNGADLRYIFTKDLTVGSMGNEVHQLQYTLKSFGYFKNPVLTYYFGPVTKAAVVSYQTKKGITPTGFVGQKTRQAMNTDLGTWNPNDYVPFYSPAEEAAIELQKQRDRDAVEAARLRAIRGY